MDGKGQKLGKEQQLGNGLKFSSCMYLFLTQNKNNEKYPFPYCIWFQQHIKWETLQSHNKMQLQHKVKWSQFDFFFCKLYCNSHVALLQVHSVSQQPVQLGSKFRRETSLRRSSYALSQGAGPGRLITSGTCIRSTVPTVDEEVAANKNPLTVTENFTWWTICDTSVTHQITHEVALIGFRLGLVRI